MRGGTAGGGLSVGLAAGELSRALARVAALAEAEPGREVCGFLVRRADRLEVWPVRNVAADPGRAFEVAPADVLAALRRADAEGLALAALYHSHPGGGPALSARDRARLAPDGEPLLAGADLVVVPVEGGRASRARVHYWCDGDFSHRDVSIPRAAAR